MKGKCKDCLYGSFRSATVVGAYEWKGVCTATKRPHYIEQGWVCSCNRYEPRPVLVKSETHETEVGCEEQG